VAKPWIDWLFLRGHVVPAKLAWRLDETPTAQGHSSNAKGPSCLLKAALIKYRRRHDVWKLAGCVAWRREDWPSCQAARRSLRAFQTSPHHFEFNLLGPALSVRMPQVPVSTDNQSAFADGPVACGQTGLVTTAILDQCCLNPYKALPTLRLCMGIGDGGMRKQ
jgi:hypothetical protein